MDGRGVTQGGEGGASRRRRFPIKIEEETSITFSASSLSSSRGIRRRGQRLELTLKEKDIGAMGPNICPVQTES